MKVCVCLYIYVRVCGGDSPVDTAGEVAETAAATVEVCCS